MSVLLIQHVSIVDSTCQYCLFDSQIANLASLPVLQNQSWGLNPRPCDTEAFDRDTGPIQIGHVDYPGKSDRTVASNRHMAFIIDFTEFTSETLKTPGHIANPVSLIFLYIRVGLMRFNTLPEFNT